MAVIREQVRFSGRVQGVGFRYTCANLAHQQGVTGWVRNEPDGSVLAELQGEQDRVTAVINGVANGQFIRVAQIYRVPMSVVASDKKFHVSF